MTLKTKTPLRSKTRLKTRTPLKTTSYMKSGKKVSEWDSVRAELKVIFKDDLKITECEARLASCWKNNGLTFAHAKKRRFLDSESLKEVILCCVSCHTEIEAYPHKKMHDFVYSIINNRDRGENNGSL